MREAGRDRGGETLQKSPLLRCPLSLLTERGLKVKFRTLDLDLVLLKSMLFCLKSKLNAVYGSTKLLVELLT